MRQVFNAYPYILPVEDSKIIDIYERYGSARRIKRGEVIKSGGDTNRLYLLKKGLCIYMINYMSDKPRALALLLPLRAMGDITCISGEVVNVTTTALRESEILVIPPDILKSRMREDFEISELVTKKVIQKQECHLEGMIANFTLSHEERLIIFYKALLLTFGKDIKEWEKLPLRLSDEELGSIIHGTRVTVNRIHMKWQEEGYFKKDKCGIYINNSLFDGIYDWHNDIALK